MSSCGSKWMTVASFAYSAVWLLHGWCHVKLLPSRRVLWIPYNHAPCHVTSSKVTYVGCKRVYLQPAGHLYFGQRDLDLLRAAKVTQGWNGCRNKSQSVQKADPGVRRANHWSIPAPTLTVSTNCHGRHTIFPWSPPPCGELSVLCAT